MAHTYKFPNGYNLNLHKINDNINNRIFFFFFEKERNLF